jgi:hypothetical protein
VGDPVTKLFSLQQICRWVSVTLAHLQEGCPIISQKDNLSPILLKKVKEAMDNFYKYLSFVFC